MTRTAMMEHLDPAKFAPFSLKTNNGDTFEVRHPELAQLMRDDTLYIFQPSTDGSILRDKLTIVRIHNICSIHKPLSDAAA